MTNSNGERQRYRNTPDPVMTDGRGIDTAIATLEGEAAQQHAPRADGHRTNIAPARWNRVPEIVEGETSYYGQPMLKPSVWSIDIPIYYFLGGTAGAALTLGAATQLACPHCEHPLRKVAAICHWTGVAGSTMGAAFLIHDLGRPSRFVYMMRVFRPTSPMNMGTWILSGAAPTAIFTALFLNRGGLLGTMAEITGYLSGLFGAALAGYTGVLVCNSAIPIWQEARRWVPVMFIASSASAAASVIDVLSDDDRTRTLTRIFGTAGRLAEIAASKQVQRVASVIPKIGEPLHRGRTGFLWKLATGLTAVSLGLSLFGGRGRKRTVVAGVLGMGGSLCLRFAVHYASNDSAREPRASFEQQRSR
jgi:formate-dependent nitrite reductase membrane component NrfD